jgi:hypothetical protein
LIRFYRAIADWLTQESDRPGPPLCDFERLRYEVRPGDVLLIEGRSRVSEVIKVITQSPWSHAALYIGRLHDITDPAVRGRVAHFHSADPDTQLVLEAILGKGVIITPLSQYFDDHIRLCRPRGLSPQDAQQVIAHSVGRLGSDYDMRQLLDLARFLFPWSFLPRRWRSSLFAHNAGQPTRTVCSTLLAESFMAVRFPILPVMKGRLRSGLALYPRNPRLFTPRDFDYSPYFEIIKYPYVDFTERVTYRHLPWVTTGEFCNTPDDCFGVSLTPEAVTAEAPNELPAPDRRAVS